MSIMSNNGSSRRVFRVDLWQVRTRTNNRVCSHDDALRRQVDFEIDTERSMIDSDTDVDASSSDS